MEQSQELAKLNLQAFVCEMRVFPNVEMNNAKEKMKNILNNTKDMSSEGLKYYLGDGVEKDKKHAIEIWKAEKDSQSILYLAVDCFRNKKLEEGVEYLRQASRMDNKIAQLRFAYCMTMGIGVAPDMEKAFNLYEKLAKEKVACAMYFVGAMQMMPNQNYIEYSPEKAQQKLLWSVKNGCKFALFEQGMVELRSAKTEEQKQQAIELVQKAAKQNEVRAMMWLSVELAKGEKLPKDTELSKKYFAKCVALQFEPAVMALNQSMKDSVK